MVPVSCFTAAEALLTGPEDAWRFSARRPGRVSTVDSPPATLRWRPSRNRRPQPSISQSSRCSVCTSQKGPVPEKKLVCHGPGDQIIAPVWGARLHRARPPTASQASCHSLSLFTLCAAAADWCFLPEHSFSCTLAISMIVPLFF